MNQLLVGASLVLLGIILLLIRTKAPAQRAGESTITGKPYLRNAGIGLMLIGNLLPGEVYHQPVL